MATDKTDRERLPTTARWPWWLAIILAAYGVLCLWQIPSIEGQRQDAPTMTCEQLARQGPDIHPYITLADVKLANDHSVTWRDAQSPGDVDTLVPIYPAGQGQEPAPRELRLILRIRDSREQARVIKATPPVEIIGTVRRAEPELEDWAKQGLEAKYPGIALNRCWVITIGVHEPSAQKVAQLRTHGFVSLVLAGVVLVVFLTVRLFALWRTVSSNPPLEGQTEPHRSPAPPNSSDG